MSELSLMAQQILDYIERYGGVSFVELEKNIEGFKGDQVLYFPNYPNVALWLWVSKEATEALNSITELLDVKPCSTLIYFTDGKVPDMKIAKRLMNYKSQRWLPVVFSVRKDKRTTTNRVG